MSNTRQDILRKLWHNRDPFSDFPRTVFAVEHQGWNSVHPYLTRAIDEVKPHIIVEIGVWKGGSLITMARHLQQSQLDAVAIGIDTRLGSSEHWIWRDRFPDLGFIAGYPNLYMKFAANVFDQNVQDFVVPLPLDSVNAFHLLMHYSIKPDIVHIDAGHDFQSVTSDLSLWWPFLNPGGVLIGDDYFDSRVWPEVNRGFDEFFAANAHASFEAADGKCYIRKSA